MRKEAGQSEPMDERPVSGIFQASIQANQPDALPLQKNVIKTFK